MIKITDSTNEQRNESPVSNLILVTAVILCCFVPLLTITLASLVTLTVVSGFYLLEGLLFITLVSVLVYLALRREAQPRSSQENERNES